MEIALAGLYKISCAIILFLFGYVFLNTLTMVSHMEIMEFFMTKGQEILLIVLGAATIFAVLMFSIHFLMKLSEKKRRILMGILIFAGVALQMFMIFGMRASLQYDSLKPVDVAMHILEGGSLSTSLYYDYFNVYPHNLCLILYMVLIFKAAAFLGIAEMHYIVILQFLHCLLIDGAVVLLYRMIKTYYSEKRAIGFLLICLINPLMYYYPVFVYTKVLGAPFITALIYLFFEAKRIKNKYHFFIYGTLYGVALYFCYKIRILCLIAPLACIITLFLAGHYRFLKRKLFWGLVASAVFSFFVCKQVSTIVYEKYTLVTDAEQEFPMQHWIMMGMNGDGKFNMDDFEFTNGFANKEERAQQTTAKAIERAKELGIGGLIDLWGRKLVKTWSDGYDDYADNLRLTAKFEPYKDYIVDDRSEFLAAYMHMFHCMICFLMVCTAIRLFSKKQPGVMYTICITIVGGMIFHMFWEASETYSMPFSLLILAAAAVGTELLENEKTEGIWSGKYSRAAAVVLFAADMVLFATMLPGLRNITFEADEIAAEQNLMEGDKIAVPAGSVCTQTTLISRPFNRLDLYIELDTEEELVSDVQIRILNAAGECEYETGAEISEKWTKCKLEFEELNSEGSTEVYAIEVQAPEQCGIAFQGYNTGNWEVYPNGHTYIDGEVAYRTDLYFAMYNEVTRTLLP